MMEPVRIELTEEEKQQYRELFRPSDGQRRKETGMTIKELAAVMAEDTTFTVLIGPDQEVVIGKEDKVLMEALGDVLIDHAMVNTANRLCIYACVDLRRATQ